MDNVLCVSYFNRHVWWDQANVAGFFDSYTDVSHSTTGLPYEAVIFYVICLILNTFILSKGIKGIEKVAKVGMPLLILLELYWR
jgi:SNF family Na+-dependent transporter